MPMVIKQSRVPLYQLMTSSLLAESCRKVKRPIHSILMDDKHVAILSDLQVTALWKMITLPHKLLDQLETHGITGEFTMGMRTYQ